MLEYVHLIPFVSNKCFSKLVSVGFGLPLEGFSEKPSSAPVISPLFHLASRSSFPLHLSGHWVDQSFEGCTLPRGKKGLKAQKVKAS
jgi:hypothetical protein